MKIIWFVHVITRTRCSKSYLNEIGVIGRRVALIKWPMTRLFWRSHMRVSWYKMKKKKCVWKWCIIKWQIEVYKAGRKYKFSMKNCEIKPRIRKNKIKTKFKKFLFFIYNTMKKSLYSLKAEYLILPRRLWKLVEIYWKPVKTMLEYDPSQVDDKRGDVKSLYFVEWNVAEKSFCWTIYWDRETATEKKKEIEQTAIWRIMQEKWFKIKDIEKKDERIKELEEENDELKSLPPVEVETIRNMDDGDIYPADDPRSKFYKEKFDERLNENLTENKKRWRSTWEK